MYQGALRVKFKKMHRLSFTKSILSGNTEGRAFYPKFSDFGLQALTKGRITNRQIETGRRYIRRSFKKDVSIKINMFPYHSFTQKPISARMGKGKGRVYGWVFPCKRGRILFEMRFSRSLILKASDRVNILNGVSKKMPVRVKLVRLIY